MWQDTLTSFLIGLGGISLAFLFLAYLSDELPRKRRK